MRQWADEVGCCADYYECGLGFQARKKPGWIQEEGKSPVWISWTSESSPLVWTFGDGTERELLWISSRHYCKGPLRRDGDGGGDDGTG